MEHNKSVSCKMEVLKTTPFLVRTLKAVLIISLLNYYLLLGSKLAAYSPGGIINHLFIGISSVPCRFTSTPFHPTAQWRIASTLAYIVLTLIVIGKRISISKSRWPPLALCICGFSFWLVIYFASWHSQVQLLDNLSLLIGFNTGLIVAGIIPDALAITICFGITASIESCLALWLYRSNDFHFISGDLVRATGTYLTPYVLAAVLLPAFPLMLGVMLQSKNFKMVCSWMTGIILGMLLLTWFRSAAGALSIATAYIA